MDTTQYERIALKNGEAVNGITNVMLFVVSLY
jgi:hypothetical protein